MKIFNKMMALAVPLVSMLLAPSLSFAIAPQNLETATFAGGCFWCLEADFDKTPGVIKTTSGYAGGHIKNPSYEQVSSGGTGHYESVQVTYNPKIVSYKKLLDVFWHHIDPTDASGQFCDKGGQYRAVIFYVNDSQKKAAIESKDALIKSGRFKHVVTQVLPLNAFYPAEEYHQNYYKKNPVRYRYYRYRCGRDQRVEELWGRGL